MRSVIQYTSPSQVQVWSCHQIKRQLVNSRADSYNEEAKESCRQQLYSTSERISFNDKPNYYTLRCTILEFLQVWWFLRWYKLHTAGTLKPGQVKFTPHFFFRSFSSSVILILGYTHLGYLTSFFASLVPFLLSSSVFHFLSWSLLRLLPSFTVILLCHFSLSIIYLSWSL